MSSVRICSPEWTVSLDDDDDDDGDRPVRYLT